MALIQLQWSNQFSFQLTIRSVRLIGRSVCLPLENGKDGYACTRRLPEVLEDTGWGGHLSQRCACGVSARSPSLRWLLPQAALHVCDM